jgi:hypothetical protein
MIKQAVSDNDDESDQDDCADGASDRPPGAFALITRFWNHCFLSSTRHYPSILALPRAS